MLTRSARFTAAVLAQVLLAACAGSVPPTTPKASPPAAAPAKPPPMSPRQRLLAALHGVARPAPLLELLPDAARSSLASRYNALSAEERAQVTSGALAAVVPLLSLQANTESRAALLALTTTPAALRELPSAFVVAPEASEPERQSALRLAHDLAARAGLQLLYDAAIDLGSAHTDEGPLLAYIQSAALAAERFDVARLALETWASVGAPESVLPALASLCARDGDEPCFASTLARVSPAAPERPRLQALAAALKSQTDPDPIVRAWSLLRLSRYGEAKAALAPVVSQAARDLRVAAALAVAESEGSACPGLQPNIGSAELCAEAFRSRAGLPKALADLELAWSTHLGRDAAASEAYVGLAHVVPWGNALLLSADAAQREHDFSERHRALAKVLAELPEQRPFAVFADALAAGISARLGARPGQPPRVDASVRQELWFAALGVDDAAARLAVSAVLSAEQPVVQLLPAAVPPTLGGARAGLLAWEAVDSAEPALLEAAKTALVEQQMAAPKGSPEGAQAVLLLAELDALSAPSERTYQALTQVAGQLIGQSVPPELAMRAVLDAAGSLERLGRRDDALGVLSKAAEIEAIPGPAGELLALVRAEKLVLAWDAKKDPERRALSKSLAALPLGAAPATLATALGLWSSPKFLKQGKLPPKASLEERVGPRAAATLLKGALRGTQVTLRVSYEFQTGITPEVRYSPLFVPLVRADLIQKAL